MKINKKNIVFVVLIISILVITPISSTMPVTDNIALENEEDCGCNPDRQPAESLIEDYDYYDEMSPDNNEEYYTGLIIPPNWDDHQPQSPAMPERDEPYPTNFDWRDFKGVDFTTPIKNQGSCGSCWAFSTVGPLESNILMNEGIEMDLSEQWLVSCSNKGTCAGGWFAHSYHKYLRDPCGDTGAVLEESFRYRAADLPCNCPYPHEYTIEGWSYIGSQWGIPSVNSIKNAILNTFGT